MHQFFVEDLSQSVVALSPEESRHAASVLRVRNGLSVLVTDGRGLMCHAEVVDVSGKSVSLKITERIADYGRRSYELCVAVAPTKNIDRYEWFLEKATEIGIDRITPLLCSHSERKVVKRDRSEKVVLAAVKQSQKAYVPQIDELTPFATFLRDLPADAQLFIAHCDPDGDKHELKELLLSGGSYVILIGPEGDFSPSEVDLAHKAGFRSVALGLSRLRTETAALYATALAAIQNI